MKAINYLTDMSRRSLI
ncbi:unnamed protein product [Victoria cruziana]